MDATGANIHCKETMELEVFPDVPKWMVIPMRSPRMFKTWLVAAQLRPHIRCSHIARVEMSVNSVCWEEFKADTMVTGGDIWWLGFHSYLTCTVDIGRYKHSTYVFAIHYHILNLGVNI